MSRLSDMIRACSACSGDYEDPDRTAATDPEDDESVAGELTTEDERRGEVDRRPTSARQTAKNTDSLVD